MLIFTMPETSKSTEIGNDFMAQMEAHKDDPVEECRFVPCDFRRIDYTHMTPEQMRYYAYWRDQLRKGKAIKADKGYFFLRMCELANIPEDAESALAQIGLMSREDEVAFSPDDYAEMMFDIAVTQGARLGDMMPCDAVREAACRGM